MEKRGRVEILLLAVVLGALAVSGIAPADRLTWLMEVLPVMLVVPCCSPPVEAAR